MGTVSAYVILMNEGFVELKIRRSRSGAKFTTVSRAFVTSSSSSENIENFRQT